MGPSKTVFVANIPFDVTEEQLAHVFGEAGPVQGVEIKFDNAGKPKGYAFVQFYDEAAADSAVRNLRGRQVGDRQLRVELSSDQPGQSRGGGNMNRGGGGGPPGRGGFQGGGGRRSPPPRQPPGPGGYGGPPGPGPVGYGGPAGPGGPPPPRVDLGMVPPGIDLPRGENAMDNISRTLADVSPGQMQDVMAGMKTLISTSPDQARQLLSQKPQLAYALFQAMLLMNIVDPQVLEHVKPMPAVPAAAPVPPPHPSYPPNGYGAAPPPPMPQQSYQPPPRPYGGPAAPPASSDPRLNSYRPPPPGPPPPGHGPGGYGAPPAQGGLTPEVQAMLSTLPEDQRTTLVSVLQMTPDQINSLDPTQRQSVMQLRQQFLGA